MCLLAQCAHLLRHSTGQRLRDKFCRQHCLCSDCRSFTTLKALGELAGLKNKQPSSDGMVRDLGTVVTRLLAFSSWLVREMGYTLILAYVDVTGKFPKILFDFYPGGGSVKF